MNQKLTAKIVYHFTLAFSKGMLKSALGADFWHEFKKRSDARFAELMSDFESIGDSLFAFNYAYAPCYVAWYTVMDSLGINAHDRDVWMLRMTERIFLTMPKFMVRALGKPYYRNMAKLAEATQKRREKSAKPLHPFDWDIAFSRVDDDNFELDIKTCGFVAYTKKYGGEGMLPGICQVDYMMADYMNVGMTRTQTLGGGGKVCDFKYCLSGSCTFDMEKRLAERR